MVAKHSLAAAIRIVRKSRGLSQEAFSDVSSRTYLSSLERDLKSPTVQKLTELCEVMEVHPLTLLTLAYAGTEQREISQLLDRVQHELDAIVANKENKRNDD
ncbi:helix-turn-helix domain-containing protein [Xanthomonas arboricola]|uniref:helix-turn-helix domain-containing protein n=1 Tax=Xanthomonas arboricola TaxID=56448 RepID=UPI000CEDF486|nr:helix-turn-helix transcriptional regulator [Xanthomonas arboricola]PPT52219.1 transcriptional regulator [Xanthomonas arboricola]